MMGDYRVVPWPELYCYSKVEYLNTTRETLLSVELKGYTKLAEGLIACLKWVRTLLDESTPTCHFSRWCLSSTAVCA